LFRVTIDPVTNKFIVCTGSSTTPIIETSWIATFDAWYYIELHCKFHLTEGLIELRINGVDIGSWSGNTGSNPSNRIQFRNFGSGTNPYIDDVAINDTSGEYNNSWPGQPRLWPVAVNGDGSDSDLSRGGVDTGANWSQVSAIPASSTSYAYGQTSDLRDLYTLNTSTVTVPDGAAIQNLILVTRALLESGAGALGACLVSDTADVENEKITALSGAYSSDSYCFPVDPDGNLPWTLARITAAEIGPILKDIT
jgi:hypothetical protein